MNWSTRRTVISRSAKCSNAGKTSLRMLRSYNARVLGASLPSRSRSPSQTSTSWPNELPAVRSPDPVVKSSRSANRVFSACSAAFFVAAVASTRRSWPSTSRNLVRARTWSPGMVLNSICPNVPIGVRGRDISSLPIAGTSRGRFALLRDPGLDIRDSELQVTTHADRTRAMTAGAPLVDRLDRHTEVVGELLGAQQRLQRRQVVRQSVDVDQVCTRARRTGSRPEPLGSRSGLGRFSRPTGHESGGFLEGGSNLRRFQARRSQ